MATNKLWYVTLGIEVLAESKEEALHFGKDSILSGVCRSEEAMEITKASLINKASEVLIALWDAKLPIESCEKVIYEYVKVRGFDKAQDSPEFNLLYLMVERVASDEQPLNE